MLSADGEVIVYHDDYIGEHRIAEMAGDEARRQLMDSPRFDELLDWCETQRMEFLDGYANHRATRGSGSAEFSHSLG